MKTLHTYLSLLFPDGCLLCQRPLTKEESCFCRHCNPHLPRTNFHLTPDNRGEQLFFGKCDVERVASFCYFEKGNQFRQTIHRFKYHDSPATAFRMGAFYAEELAKTNWQTPIDLIIPVPLHPLKLLKRGYNQSEWIAKGLHSVWQIPVNTRLLRKKANTDTQTRRSLYDRYINAQNSFTKRHELPPHVKHLLLVDDVLTSGSTLEACVHALNDASDVKISILTLGFAE